MHMFTKMRWSSLIWRFVSSSWHQYTKFLTFENCMSRKLGQPKIQMTDSRFLHIFILILSMYNMYIIYPICFEICISWKQVFADNVLYNFYVETCFHLLCLWKYLNFLNFCYNISQKCHESYSSKYSLNCLNHVLIIKLHTHHNHHYSPSIPIKMNTTIWQEKRFWGIVHKHTRILTCRHHTCFWLLWS